MNDTLLKALIDPETVALVGASDNPAKLTARPQNFLRQHGFRGRVYPVNPVRETVQGVTAYPSVSAIPEPVDHAYILVDAEPAMAALADCAKAGVKVVSMLADGFAEAGPEGQERQQRLEKIAREAGILVVGPNSTGVVNIPNAFICTTNAAFRADGLRAGRVAVLSQSGSLSGTLLSRGEAMNLGFSTLISVGNEAGAGVGELGRLLVDDPGTDAFILFLETLRDRDSLADFARLAAGRGKPVVAYVIGRSDEGQALSVSHTGAITGGRAALASYLASLGIRQVDVFETLLAAPGALVSARLPKRRPPTVTVLSTTGGGGAMVLDQISARGVPIAGCSAAARATLEAENIPLGHGKLVDVTLAGTKYETMRKVIDTLVRDPETGLLVVAIGSSARFNPELAVKPIVDASAEAPDDAAPIVAIPLPDAPESLRMLGDAGIPAFRSIEVCAETVAMLMRPATPAPVIRCEPDAAVEALLSAAAGATMDELDSGTVFETLGLSRPAFCLVGPDEDLPADLGFSFPVVAKLVSPNLPHKTDAGAIVVGITDREALVDAIARMKASAEQHKPGYALRGVLIQEMKRGIGEALIGMTRDPLAGPVLTVAAGGVMTEIYKDASVRPAPVSLETARGMIDEVKAFALLKGFRGRPRGDLDALAAAIADFSRIAAYESVLEAEINPILVHAEGEGVTMLDALIERRATPEQ